MFLTAQPLSGILPGRCNAVKIYWRKYPYVWRPYRQRTLVFYSVLSFLVLIPAGRCPAVCGSRHPDVLRAPFEHVARKSVPLSIDIRPRKRPKANRPLETALTAGGLSSCKEVFARLSPGAMRRMKVNIPRRRASVLNMMDALSQMRPLPGLAAALRDTEERGYIGRRPDVRSLGSTISLPEGSRANEYPRPMPLYHARKRGAGGRRGTQVR